MKLASRIRLHRVVGLFLLGIALTVPIVWRLLGEDIVAHYRAQYWVGQLKAGGRGTIDEVGVASQGLGWRSCTATDTVIQIGYPAVPGLLRALRSQDPFQRRRAWIALECIRHPTLSPRRLSRDDEDLLSDYDPGEKSEKVREAAARKWDKWWSECTRR